MLAAACLKVGNKTAPAARNKRPAACGDDSLRNFEGRALGTAAVQRRNDLQHRQRKRRPGTRGFFLVPRFFRHSRRLLFRYRHNFPIGLLPSRWPLPPLAPSLLTVKGAR